MNDYEIVIDSTCDLNREIRNKFHLYEDYIHSIVYLPDKEITADLEWSNYSPDDYYSIIRKKVGLVKTAFATMEEFSRVVKPILDAGKDAIVVVISSGLSGTANGYRNFADAILDDYPERKITIIDSLKYASASGLLAIYGGINKTNGMSYEDNVNWMNENRYRIHQSGAMDDLRYLAKNGRISATKAFFGSLIGVQPFADFSFDGKNVPLGTLKGDDSVNKCALEYLKATIENPEEQIIIISHSQREKRAKLLKEQLEKEIKCKEIITIQVAESCGPNVGPGLCCYFYLGNKLTPEREKEQKWFDAYKEANK